MTFDFDLDICSPTPSSLPAPTPVAPTPTFTPVDVQSDTTDTGADFALIAPQPPVDRTADAVQKKAAAQQKKAADLVEKEHRKQEREAKKAAKDATAAAVQTTKIEADRPRDVSHGQFAGPADLPAALAEIAAATEVSLDLETTALTPWAVAEAPGAATKLGNGVTTKAYARRYDCTLDARPRPRIISLRAIPSGESRAFDLDLLSPHDRESLVSVLHGKVWVGHNLAFDLMWLRAMVPTVAPRALVDTLLLGTTHTPDFEFAVRDLFGSPVTPGYLCEGGSRDHWGLPDTLTQGTDAHAQMRSMLAQRAARNKAAAVGEPGRALPLDFLSVALLGEKLDKAYQKPHNWMPSVLTTGHYAYCVGDITQPPKIARILLGVSPTCSTQDLLAAIAAHPGAKAYGVFTRAAVRLTQMQRTGLFLSPDATAAYVQKHTADAAQALSALLADLPELGVHRGALLDPDKGLADDIKEAFARGLTRLTGKPPERTETGSPKLDAKALKLVYRDLPALAHYNTLTGALKRASMALAYLAQADAQGRLHSMVSITTVTGRTASQEPNLQNAPRGQDFRALFAAPQGKQIIAVDYSAIEMRVAAALTLRAYRVFRALLDTAAEGDRRGYEQQARALGMHWFLGDVGRPNKDGSLAAIDALVYLMHYGTPHDDAITSPGERPVLDGSTIDDWRNYYSGLLHSVISSMQSAGAFQPDPAHDRLVLADVFARGLDPHIITALATESAAGRFDLDGVIPTEFVAALVKTESDALKMRLKGPRQAAKVQNFGLLYGMQGNMLHAYGITNYGLDWALDEALFAADAWFGLYPEVRLWHLITRGVKQKLFVDSLEPQKMFRATTLSGRPVCSDKLPSALNFQDQGTGAEIALAAIVNLPNHLAAELVNFVHDELVFEVPADLADERTAEIERVMINAADRLLLDSFGVPTEVESAGGDYWIH